MIALAQLGFPIIFFIVFGEVSTTLLGRFDALEGTFWASKEFTKPLLGLAMLYLVLQKEVHSLKYAGFILLLFIMVFFILFGVHYFVSDPDPERPVDLTETKLDVEFFASFPTILSSYGIQTSFFTAFHSMKRKTAKNGMIASSSAILIMFVVYMVTPLISYGLYGADVDKDLMKNIDRETEVLPTILQCLFLVITVMHIPIIFFIGKEAVLIMFDEATRRSYSKQMQIHPDDASSTDQEAQGW